MSDAKPDQNWRTRHIDEKLGPRVEQLHGERGFSRADVARRLGVTNAAMQHIEEGRVRMSASQLWQICGATGIDIADVFAGLPTHIHRTKADYDHFEELKRLPASPSKDAGAISTSHNLAGVNDPPQPFEGGLGKRADLVKLAKIARHLSAEQVALLIGAAKGLRP